jgi:hypothetical protein
VPRSPRDYPNVTFVAGQLIFKKETWLDRLLQIRPHMPCKAPPVGGMTMIICRFALR